MPYASNATKSTWWYSIHTELVSSSENGRKPSISGTFAAFSRKITPYVRFVTDTADSNILTFRFGLIWTLVTMLCIMKMGIGYATTSMIRQIEASLRSSLLVCRNPIRSKVRLMIKIMDNQPCQILV